MPRHQTGQHVMELALQCESLWCVLGNKAGGLTRVFSGTAMYCCQVPDGHGTAITLCPFLKAPELVTISPTPCNTPV